MLETIHVLTAIGGIAVVAAVVALRRRNVARGESRAAAAAAVDHYRRTRDKADLGLMCPACGGVAEPMCDTHDRYRCVECAGEFIAKRHEWKTE
jgi:DNA-directed RNA polymerase subunit RPC12/RpoP